MSKREIIEKVLEEITQSARELLEWSEANPGCTLGELEEKVKAWKGRGRGVLPDC